MESASGSITLKKATRKDIKEITELIYITEPEPELEWGYGSEKERKQVLEHLMKIKNNRFSLKNFIVARKDNKLIGMALLIDGKDITKYSNKELIKYRRNDIGFVFQFYNLVQNLTAKENVELATEICKKHLSPVKTLKAVGLENRLNNFPAQLSGGEQQRVAIARAVAKNPKILLADEPTGALDDVTGKQILKVLEKLSRQDKMTVIIITHNSAIAPIADKVIRFKNGQAESTTINKNPKNVEDINW